MKEDPYYEKNSWIELQLWIFRSIFYTHFICPWFPVRQLPCWCTDFCKRTADDKICSKNQLLKFYRTKRFAVKKSKKSYHLIHYNFRRIKWKYFLYSNRDAFRSVGLYYKWIICVQTFTKSIKLTNVVKYFELHSETSKIWHRNAFLYVSGCFLPDSEKGLQKRFFPPFPYRKNSFDYN